MSGGKTARKCLAQPQDAGKQLARLRPCLLQVRNREGLPQPVPQQADHAARSSPHKPYFALSGVLPCLATLFARVYSFSSLCHPLPRNTRQYGRRLQQCHDQQVAAGDQDRKGPARGRNVRALISTTGARIPGRLQCHQPVAVRHHLQPAPRKRLVCARPPCCSHSADLLHVHQHTYPGA